VHYDRRLRECNYGGFNGAPAETVARERRRRIDEPFPGGESLRQVVDRVASLLEEVARGPDGATVVLIGPSATRWAIEHLLEGTALEELVDAPFAWREGWLYTLPWGWRRSQA
jgi:broad specificity phosphatase PhoE